jgi:hypothetical protein
MPSTTPEVRQDIAALFTEVIRITASGDSDFIYECEKFLKVRGYTITDKGFIIPPRFRSSHLENLCIAYLCEEWDYGIGEKSPGDPMEG